MQGGRVYWKLIDQELLLCLSGPGKEKDASAQRRGRSTRHSSSSRARAMLRFRKLLGQVQALVRNKTDNGERPAHSYRNSSGIEVTEDYGSSISPPPDLEYKRNLSQSARINARMPREREARC